MADRSNTHDNTRKMLEADYEVGKPNAPPKLYRLDDYYRWSERFLDYLRYTDWKMYLCISAHTPGHFYVEVLFAK